MGGAVNLDRIRPVSVGDLLGRDPMEMDLTSRHELLGGGTVMVTGAGGSIGVDRSCTMPHPVVPVGPPPCRRTAN